MGTFNDVINSGQLVLADFFATWCGPCKAMHPVLEQLKANLGDRLRIIKVDIDKHVMSSTKPHSLASEAVSHPPVFINACRSACGLRHRAAYMAAT